jgi:hypothetical protein
VSDIHLLTAIAKKYACLSTGERIKKVRKLVGKSPENKRFIRKYFPDLYDEACSTSHGARASSESSQQHALSAKPR